MTYQVRLSLEAKEDIAKALSWTKTRFGPKQRAAYKRLIHISLRHLSEQPLQPPSRRRKDIGPDFYVLHISRRGKKARHFFLFRPAEPKIVQVAHFLYDSMDVIAFRE